MWNALLPSIDKMLPLIGLVVDLFTGEVSLQLIGLFNCNVLHGALDEKLYQSTYMVIDLFVLF